MCMHLAHVMYHREEKDIEGRVWSFLYMLCMYIRLPSREDGDVFMNVNWNFCGIWLFFLAIDRGVCLNSTNQTITVCDQNVQQWASVSIIVISSLFLLVSCYEITRENSIRESE